MIFRSTKTFVPVALLAAAIAATAASPQQISKAVKVVQLTGLPGMKENAKGILSVENGSLHFVHGKAAVTVGAVPLFSAIFARISRRHAFPCIRPQSC